MQSAVSRNDTFSVPNGRESRNLPRRFISLLTGLVCLAGSSLAVAQIQVDGSFYCTDKAQYYTLFNTSFKDSPLYISLIDDTLYVALVVRTDAVNDNVVGNRPYTRSAGWNPPRSIRRLTDSEYAEFELTIGGQTWSWRQGYAGQVDQNGNFFDGNETNNTNAGGRTWMSGTEVAGGEAPGGLPPGLTMASSLAWNMNRYAANLSNPNNGSTGLWNMNVNGTGPGDWKSPFLASAPNNVAVVDGWSDGQATCSTQFEWEWSMVYEFSVDLSSFGPNPIFVLSGNSHHSPMKSTGIPPCGPEDDCFPEPEDFTLTDYGDLPPPYPTLRSDQLDQNGTGGTGGARHSIFSNSAYLGANVADPESNGQPHPAALGDDRSGINDEDGIRILTPQWIAGQTATFEVTIGRQGYLSAFIDFNGDGTLTQPNVVSVTGPASVATGALGDRLFPAPGVYSVTVDLPADTGDLLATRWRITNEAGQGGNSPIGRAESGEVEDHMFQRMEAIDVRAVCGTGANNNPLELVAQVNGVSEVEFFYWQNGVSTEWTSAVAWDETTNPVTLAATADNDPVNGFGDDGFPNIWTMEWNMLAFNFNAGQLFQIRVEGRDEFNNVVAQTLLEYNAAICDTTGTPVTISSFESRVEGNRLVVDWATSSEIANAGFNLYGETADGEWIELTEEMVASEVIDSAEPQFYSVIANARGIERLFLEDVDVFGQTELHGPFAIDGGYGHRPQVMAIDWQHVRSQPGLNRVSANGRGWRHQNRDPIRLLTTEAGVYRFNHADLLEAGMDLSGVPVSQIALKNRGQIVQFHTEARGRFGPDDFIEFYARPIDTLYTNTNVYVLEIDNRFGQHMGQDTAARQSGFAGSIAQRPPIDRYMASVWVGEERQYLASSFIETPWYDTRMLVTGSPRNYDFSVEIDSALRLDLTLVPDYWGLTTVPDVEPDHHVQIYFNGELVHDDWFNGRVRRQPEITIPARFVRDGTNMVRFRLPADTGASVDGVGLTGFEVRYERVLHAHDGSLEFSGTGSTFRVTGLTTPEPVVYRIEGDSVTRIQRLRAEAENDGSYTVQFPGLVRGEATYVVTDPNSLPVPAMEPGLSRVDITSGRADYLMIAHPAFIEGLQPLVDFHESRGLKVRVVNVNDIYDQFSHGIFDAQAIQDYIRATSSRMGYQYVLLVGGDTFDYKNNLGLNSFSFIPSLYTHTDNFVRYAPADALYVDLSGDEVPELAIGRFPVRTTTELAEVIEKTFEYVNRKYRRTAVLATDHQEPGVFYRQHLESLTDQGLAGWDVRRAHLDELSVADARNELISAINSGTSLTTYLGHSAHTVWSFSGLFQSSDVANLTNFGKPTAVAQWGCWNTYHVGPAYQTLGHRFMLTPNRGAALVMGSSTFSHVHSGRLLGERLIPMLIQPDVSAGRALYMAQQDLAKTHPFARDAILGWTILGDPALMIGD
jgi:hypothetical protein